MSSQVDSSFFFDMASSKSFPSPKPSPHIPFNLCNHNSIQKEPFMEDHTLHTLSSTSLSYSISDEGYHTPTSPGHRISPSVECPPAPKKPVSLRLRRRRKTGRGRRLFQHWLEVAGFELISRPVKKAKVGEGINQACDS